MMEDGLTRFVEGVTPELQRCGLLRRMQTEGTMRDAARPEAPAAPEGGTLPAPPSRSHADE